MYPAFDDAPNSFTHDSLLALNEALSLSLNSLLTTSADSIVAFEYTLFNLIAVPCLSNPKTVSLFIDI